MQINKKNKQSMIWFVKTIIGGTAPRFDRQLNNTLTGIYPGGITPIIIPRLTING